MNLIETVTSFSHATGDRAGIEALNSVDFMPVRFLPVDAVHFDIEIDGSLSPMFHVWKTRSRSGFKTVLAVVAEVLTLRVPITGGMRWRDRRDDFVIQPGQGSLLPFGSLFNLEAAADIDVLSCTVKSELLAASYRALGHHDTFDPLGFRPVVDFDTPPLRALAASLQRIFMLMRDYRGSDDMVMEMLSEIFIYQLLSAWPQLGVAERDREVPASRKAAYDARAYIDANLGRSMTIAEIANAADIGVRTLQKEFRRTFAQTPMQYVIATRLERTYDDLQRNPDVPVATIARRWGFAHLSDFSRRYALRFGTTPSSTRPRS